MELNFKSIRIQISDLFGAEIIAESSTARSALMAAQVGVSIGISNPFEFESRILLNLNFEPV